MQDLGQITSPVWGRFLTSVNENNNSANFIVLLQGLNELKFVELKMVLNTY